MFSSRTAERRSCIQFSLSLWDSCQIDSDGNGRGSPAPQSKDIDDALYRTVEERLCTANREKHQFDFIQVDYKGSIVRRNAGAAKNG